MKLGLTSLVVGMLFSTALSAGQMTISNDKITPSKEAQLICAKYAWACSDKSGYSASMEALVNVNSTVNKIKPVSDMTQYKVVDKWTLPSKRGADCEDYALLKKKLLIDKGFDARSLLIAVAIDKHSEFHAVLVVRTQNGNVVLDNMTNKIKDWSDTNLKFVYIQNPLDPDTWVLVR